MAARLPGCRPPRTASTKSGASRVSRRTRPRMAHKCLVIMQILGNRKYDARKKSFAAPCLLDFRKWNGRCLDLEIGFDSRLQ